MADDDWSFLDDLANIGFDATDFDGLVFDTLTGDFVDASTIDPRDLADFGIGGLDPSGSPDLPSSSVSGSTSDMLRSMEADSQTYGREAFDPANMADPSASIASASGDNGWAKALAQGLGNALAGLGGGMKGLAGDAPGSVPGINVPGVGSAPGVSSAPGVGGTPMMSGDFPRVGDAQGAAMPGLQGLLGTPAMMHPAGQESIGAAYTSTTPLQRAQMAMQSAIDAGPPARQFTPLALPTAGGGVPMAQQGAQPRMSGLQKLLQERLG